MKKKITSVLLGTITAIFITASFVNAQSITSTSRVCFETIPETISEFLAMRDELGDTPEGAATLFVNAMIIYTENEDLGIQCFTVILDRDNLQRSVPGAYKGWDPSVGFTKDIRKVLYNSAIARSYIEETTPIDNYTINKKTSHSCYFDINTTRRVDVITYDMFLYSTGANNPRRIRLRKNNHGFWKVLDASFLFGHVTPARYKTDDDL